MAELKSKSDAAPDPLGLKGAPRSPAAPGSDPVAVELDPRIERAADPDEPPALRPVTVPAGAGDAAAGGIPTLARVLKRAADIVLSAAGLVVLAPVFALITIAIRLDTRGGAVFRQHRPGRNGIPFVMLKFRTMVDGADSMRPQFWHLTHGDGNFKIPDDPRVTRVGRFLRRHSLDELPQLVNVLRGEMSLIGPRPLPFDEDERVIGEARGRSSVRPGITGPWQLRGPINSSLAEMAYLDCRYVSEWSFAREVWIVAMTIRHVVRGRGV